MYYLYLLGFKLLYGLGLRKTSVRIARYLEQEYCHRPREAAELYTAIWDFVLTQAFPLCDDTDAGCFFPILSDDDPFHKSCREKLAEIDAAWAEHDAEKALQAEAEIERIDAGKEHYAELIASFCTQSGCFEPHNGCGKCHTHDTFCMTCMSDPCRCADMYDDEVEEDEYQPDDQSAEECPDGCGQPYYACTCAELASLQRYYATPLEQRDGIWTA